MTTSAAGAASLVTFLFSSKNEPGLVHKLGEHVSHGESKGDEDEYFLKYFHNYFKV